MKTHAPPEAEFVRLLKGFAHPIRLRILQELGDAERSPSELATDVRKPLAVVSYHVKVLVREGALELVREAPARGALQHFYRVSPAAKDLLRVLPARRAGLRDYI